MAISVTISLDSICGGGTHANLSISVDGQQARVRDFNTDDLRGALTNDEKETLVSLLVRAKISGMTRAQARNTLQSGFTVTL